MTASGEAADRAGCAACATSRACRRPRRSRAEWDRARAAMLGGPGVIGATGGSGTRVLARIVLRGGMFIGSDRNRSEDALDFAAFSDRWVDELVGRELAGRDDRRAARARRAAVGREAPATGRGAGRSRARSTCSRSSTRSCPGSASSTSSATAGTWRSRTIRCSSASTAPRCWATAAASPRRCARSRSGARSTSARPTTASGSSAPATCASASRTSAPTRRRSTADVLGFFGLHGDASPIAREEVRPPSSLGRWRDEDAVRDRRARGRRGRGAAALRLPVLVGVEARPDLARDLAQPRGLVGVEERAPALGDRRRCRRGPRGASGAAAGFPGALWRSISLPRVRGQLEPEPLVEALERRRAARARRPRGARTPSRVPLGSRRRRVEMRQSRPPARAVPGLAGGPPRRRCSRSSSRTSRSGRPAEPEHARREGGGVADRHDDVHPEPLREPLGRQQRDRVLHERPRVRAPRARERDRVLRGAHGLGRGSAAPAAARR